MRSSSIVPTTTVAEVAFSNVTMQETVALILLIVQKGNSAQHICTGNLDHLFQLQSDAEFRRAYESAALVLPDGMPIVWMSHLSRQKEQKPLRERVAGSDLFWELVQASEVYGLRLFFLGGAPGSAEKARAVAQERFPGCHICGVYCPPQETFNTAQEQAHIESLVREAAPDVLLVGLGAPKQEKWIHANKARLGVPVSVGVGGTFEMAAGVVRRAPRWMQSSGTEWMYRLVQDPSRLWRRYLCNDLPFLMRLLARSLRHRVVAPLPVEAARPTSDNPALAPVAGQESNINR